ncbi:MAG: hypothetical protein HYX69_23265 [Planctomycetia bacterium]|nr:hypothetical protein [Planctomycetia bacterium]
MHRTGKRLAGVSALGLAGVAVAVVLFAASTVSATSGIGTQNPDVTVKVSLSPDVVSIGGTVHGEASATNNTNRRKKFTARATLTLPNGSKYSETRSRYLNAGETYTLTEDLVVPSYAPLGTYYLTIAVSDNRGTSRATASVTVQ